MEYESTLNNSECRIAYIVKVKKMVRLKNGYKISKKRYDQLKHTYMTKPSLRPLTLWFLKVEFDPDQLKRFKDLISKDPESFLYKHPKLNNKKENY